MESLNKGHIRVRSTVGETVLISEVNLQQDTVVLLNKGDQVYCQRGLIIY